jgi:hypothetical protein
MKPKQEMKHGQMYEEKPSEYEQRRKIQTQAIL